MKHLPALGVLALSVASLTAACGGDGDTTATSQGTGAATTATTSGSGGSGGAASTTSAGGAGTTTTGGPTSTTAGSTSSSAGSTGVGGGMMGVADPNVDGPYPIKEIDDTATAAATGHKVPIHAAYPSGGPTAGPYPVILVAHGFQLPAAQYKGYVKRLASFGYVALTADFPAGFVGINNVENAKDLLAGLDWAATKAELAGKADVNKAGATGHSLGGKVSIIAASMDARIKATITLDPVDGAMNCTPQNCPDASTLVPTLTIPTGFLGETTDAAGGFQPCAPAADNFTTFYAGAKSPSLMVTVTGANHMSFLDDVATCGFICSFCNMATAPNAQVNALAKAYVVAFYERHLRGDLAYDTYLTGAQAQARYVTTNQATIVSK
jgi:chlorophyllase